MERFVKRWGVDSFKIDGVDLNHAPLCYNPAHHHARPEESFEQWPGLFREIRETARSIRPDFRIELCPCGITPTYQLGTAFEQPVTSDPFDYQVTQRVKFLKAWFGPTAPVLEEYVGLLGQKEPNGKPYTFRVELYPRAIGTGAVVSTFSPVLDKSHAAWTALYNRQGLASGEYLNLYDVGWDNPEGHVIRKGGRLYYAFYARVPGEEFSGKITLRGLGSERYRVTDYAHHLEFGVVAGPDPSLSVSFHDSLLLMAEPLAPPAKNLRLAKTNMERTRQRVLFLMPTWWRGAERMLVLLLRHLDRSASAAPGIGRGGRSLFEEVPSDVPIHDLKAGRVRRAWPAILRLAGRLRPQVIHSAMVELNLAAVLARPLLPPGVRLVLREDSSPTAQNLQGRKHPRLWNWLYRHLYPRADSIICVGDYVRDDLAANFGISRSILKRVYNAVDIDRARQGAEAGGNPYAARDRILWRRGGCRGKKGSTFFSKPCPGCGRRFPSATSPWWATGRSSRNSWCSGSG